MKKNPTREERRIKRLNIALVVVWGLVLVCCIAIWAMSQTNQGG